MAGLNSNVLHDNTAQNNPPSLFLSPDVDDASPGPPNPGTACHSPRRRCRKVAAPQVVDRQSYTNTNILIIIMIQMQSRVPVKNGNKRLYPAKITRELLLCATATTTTKFF